MSFKKLTFFATVILAWFSIVGCPQPFERKVKFYKDSKITDKYVIKIGEGNCWLTITCKTGFRDQSYADLFVEAEYRGSSATKFKFKPGNLKFLVDKQGLNYRTDLKIHSPLDGERKEYIIPFPNTDGYFFNFNYAMPTKIMMNSLETFDYEIEIILDSFVFYKGETVAIDTIEVCCI